MRLLLIDEFDRVVQKLPATLQNVAITAKKREQQMKDVARRRSFSLGPGIQEGSKGLIGIGKQKADTTGRRSICNADAKRGLEKSGVSGETKELAGTVADAPSSRQSKRRTSICNADAKRGNVVVKAAKVVADESKKDSPTPPPKEIKVDTLLEQPTRLQGKKITTVTDLALDVTHWQTGMNVK